MLQTIGLCQTCISRQQQQLLLLPCPALPQAPARYRLNTPNPTQHPSPESLICPSHAELSPPGAAGPLLPVLSLLLLLSSAGAASLKLRSGSSSPVFFK